MPQTIFLLLSFGLLISCAKPNYQNPESSVQPQETPGLTKPGTPEKCELFLKTERLCTKISWTVKPKNSTETGSFNFKFYVQENPEKLIEPRGNAFVELWMPSMGHGSSPVTVEKISEGLYRAKNVFFIMPGEWEIRIQVRDGKNVTDQISQKFTL